MDTLNEKLEVIYATARFLKDDYSDFEEMFALRVTVAAI